MNIYHHLLTSTIQERKSPQLKTSLFIANTNNTNIESSNETDICKGFTLTELLIAIAIVGILSAVALPNYFNQVQKTRQNEAATTLTQVQTTIAAFVDEMGLLPGGWDDLNKITPLMTPEGPAEKKNFSSVSIASAGCTKTSGNNCYKVIVREKNQFFTLEAKSNNSICFQENSFACIKCARAHSN